MMLQPPHASVLSVVILTSGVIGFSTEVRASNDPSIAKTPETPPEIIPEISIDRFAPSLLTQRIDPPDSGTISPQADPPSLEPIPETLPLPPPDELLESPVFPNPEDAAPNTPDTIVVTRFEVVGSTVFSAAELTEITEPYTNRPLSFAELLEARSAVTQLYVDAGYITSGAYIPPQTLTEGTVMIQVVEGTLDEITVTGTRRLNSDYVRSRIAVAATEPLNVDRLLAGLQLLQLNPLIENLSANLAAGVRPGTSTLNVAVTEADSFSATLEVDNARSPSVGTFQQQVSVTEANLLGWGDSLSVGYQHTDGSDGIDASYQLPINPRNGTLSFSFGLTEGEVIESPFDALGIEATSRYYELSLRQPLSQSPTEEFALGLTLSHQQSQTEFGIDVGEDFSLPGTDAEGRTRVTALRFSQEWIQQGARQVLAARSQFSLGLDALGATVNDSDPDAEFFSWRGQGQWVRLLAPDTLLFVRADMQLANDALVSLEQFGVGGQRSVRGYRRDQLLTDNGVFASAEVRIPVMRVPNIDGLLQVAPFFDVGVGWNDKAPQPEEEVLTSIGLGLLWQQERLSARIDFGIPLVSADDQNQTWQENGLYFSIIFSPF